jgi:hypothetical protein
LQFDDNGPVRWPSIPRSTPKRRGRFDDAAHPAEHVDDGIKDKIVARQQ